MSGSALPRSAHLPAATLVADAPLAAAQPRVTGLRVSARWLVLACLALLAVSLVGSQAVSPTSSIRHLDIPSAALGRPMPVSVYEPAGAAPPEGWPVLYLLHGLGGTERDWLGLGGVQGTLDRMIAAGQIQPMLVVMPDGGKNSWYVDSRPQGGAGNYQSAMLDDLPQAIEGRFPVRRDRGGRAIAGNSMGGFGALRLGLIRPDRYAAVAGLSPAIWQNVPLDLRPDASPLSKLLADSSYFYRLDPTTVVSGVVLPNAKDRFGKSFGSPFDGRLFNRQNVFTLLARQVDAHATLPALYLTCGDHDAHDLWRGAIAFYETLKAGNQEVQFRMTGGDHTWSLWRQSIGDALLFVDAHFTRPVAGG